MAELAPNPKLQFFDSNGNPLSGGKLYTYAAGTTTPLATYTDSSGGGSNTNPITLDSRGECDIWIGSAAYKFVLKDSAGATIWTADNISGFSALHAQILAEFSASSGSTLMGFMQAGTGAVARTAQAKMREQVSLEDYFVAGETSWTPSFNRAITYLDSVGGGELLLPWGDVPINATVRNSKNHILLVGRGGAVDGNVTYVGGMTAAIASAGTRIHWTGAAGGTMFELTPYPDDGTQAAVIGGGMVDVMIDGASSAAIGLDLKTLRYSRFENVSVMRCTSINWNVGTTTANVLGGNKSLAFCSFINCTGSNATLGGTAKTLVCYGHITDGNVAINKWDNCGFYSGTGVGSHIEIENSDSNTFSHCRWNGSLTLHATDTGSYSTSDAVARHNVFLNPQGHIIAKAKVATPHTQGTNGYDSYGNMALGYSRENGIAYPTIEAYADFYFRQTGLGLTNKEGGTEFGGAPNITLMAKTVDQAIVSGVTTAVDWTAVSYDWLGCGDATLNRITAPNGCKWVRFIYGVEWANNSTAGRFVGVRVNGATVISKNQNSGYINSQEVVSTQWFAVTPGDYYEMVVSQNTGSDLNLLGTTATFMQAEWC